MNNIKLTKPNANGKPLQQNNIDQHWKRDWRNTETAMEKFVDRISDPIPVVNLAVDQYLYHKKTRERQAARKAAAESIDNKPFIPKFDRAKYLTSSRELIGKGGKPPKWPLVGVEPNPGPPKVEVKIEEKKVQPKSKNSVVVVENAKSKRRRRRNNGNTTSTANSNATQGRNARVKYPRPLRPFINADNIAVAWRQHMLDPWNFPPVSLGRTTAKSAIGWGYSKMITPSSTAYDALFWSAIPGYYYNNSGTYPLLAFYSLGNANWTGLSSSSQYYSNYAAIANIAMEIRPISLAIRIALRYPSTTMPPYLFAGCVPAGIPTNDAAKIGSTAITTPTMTRGAPITQDTDSNTFAVSWVPQDQHEIETFTNIYTTSAQITTMPYIGFVGGAAATGAWSCEVEIISFFEYEQNYSNLSYATVNEPTVRYTGNEIWDAYMARGYSTCTAHVPKWTNIHEKNPSFNKGSGVNYSGSSRNVSSRLEHFENKEEIKIPSDSANRIFQLLSPVDRTSDNGEITITPSKYDELCRLIHTMKVEEEHDFEVPTPELSGNKRSIK